MGRVATNVNTFVVIADEQEMFDIISEMSEQ
jgi:hypothetical protein